jgi:hypothetical protein
MVRLGSDNETETGSSDTLVLEVLKSPLLCMVPEAVLGDSFTGPPVGVAMVEQATGLNLQGAFSSVGSASSELDSALEEMVACQSERSSAAVKHLQEAAKDKSRPLLAPQVHRLLFCILVKQSEASDSLRYLLEAVADGKDPGNVALPKLWLQARRLEPWLLSVKQRLAAAGRQGSSVVEVMERVLRIILSSEQLELDAAMAATEDDGLDVLWARQRMSMDALKLPTTPTSAQMSPTSHWNELSTGANSVKRLQLLLKQVPQSGVATYAQQVKDLFEARWFSSNDPVLS